MHSHRNGFADSLHFESFAGEDRVVMATYYGRSSQAKPLLANDEVETLALIKPTNRDA